jgi:Spy/CpxP family protein refolding chaperone
MKNSLFKYVLILSLLLNFSFLGAAGYTHYQQSRYQTAPCGYGVQERASVSSNQPHLFEALSLRPEQRKLFEQKAQLFHQALDKKGAEVGRLRETLVGLMRAGQPDNQSIETTIAEINGVQQEMQKMIVTHMLEFKSMLSPDQQKKFFDLIQGAMAGRQEIQCP